MPQNAKNAPKCPKTCAKTINDHFSKHRFLVIFRPLWRIFGHFRLSWGVEGGVNRQKMTKNDQIWPKTAKKHLHIAHITHQNAPKHPEVVVEKKGFPTFLDALPKIIYLEPGSGPFQISIWVILPVENTPKHPKTPQNTPKHPKTPQNMYKNPQGPFLEKSTFGDFSTSMTHFRSFSALLGFWGGCQQGRKWPKMTKNDQKRQKSYHNCPDNPEKSP